MQAANVERFSIRERHEWADIYLDEERGLFFAYSSFGTYAHCWWSRGSQTLREFVRGLDFGYFMQKTYGNGYRQFDWDESVQGIKRHVIEARRSGDLDAETARVAFDAAADMEDSHGDEHEFYDTVFGEAAFNRIFRGDYAGLSRQVDNPQCRGFWTVIWPKFLREIEPQTAAA